MGNLAKSVKKVRGIKVLFVCVLVFALLLSPLMIKDVNAAVLPEINIAIGGGQLGEDGEAPDSVTLQLLFLTIFLVLLPAILVVMTSFTRLIIIFSFLRSGMGTQQMPPNTVLIGLALMLTMFVMNPTITYINENALAPLTAGEITQQEAIDTTVEGFRRFMLAQGREGHRGMGGNIDFFARLANFELEVDANGHIIDEDTIPTYVLIPAFILHEVSIAFTFGVFIFIPFIVIDMVVASVLMAMGMMMLPPAMISLPFKVMLFVLVDGWRLVIYTAISTFQGG
jgi:flagellar biosynthetic protein FliP